MGIPEHIIPYAPTFLGERFIVPLPALSPTLRTQAYAEAAVIDYTRFSLVMHSKRKVAIFAACNIDAARKVRVSDAISWRMDERVGDCQLGPEKVANGQLNSGRLVRRENVLWGPVSEARHANKSTFFYSNAVPLHPGLNHAAWETLEDRVLDRTTNPSCRLCVFTGPVLRDNDRTVEDLPPYDRAAFNSPGAVRIPAALWKVIVRRDGSAEEGLSAMAFAMRQSEMWNDTEGSQLHTLKVHQVTLRAIERWTGLDFGDLKRSDQLEGLHGPTEWPQIRPNR
jgi:endonuclease G, mitochondrial